VPVLLDLRELMPELFMSRFSLARRSVIVRLLALLEKSACAYADGVFVLHERHRRILLGRGIPAAKLTQVMNCPDERIFDPDCVPPRQRPANGRFTVVNHGGILQRYGVDLLVEAVGQVRGEIPGVRLELYGTGDFRAEVERLVAERQMQDIVDFHGQRPLEEIPLAVSRADVGVAPMRQDVFTDCGLPTKLLEYVTLGIPAIASRTATTADYFDDSMVLLFEPGNPADLASKLLQVYRDPDAALERSVRAKRLFSDRYNWRGEGAAYLQTVDRLIHKTNSLRH
jgi:glycosyltransferase involved in cell wall biosynthesis